ncbi:MAG TPA: hypothetical protein VHK01_20765 [Lacipirellulaceae bacterium]|nr:hypothetical protein [Lacipirellulaceae bacterium]
MDAEKGTARLAVCYAATIFLSALLLFHIQPLVSKHILPQFGGSPAVWTICLLFFQTLLLAGYIYAHISHRWLRPRQQALLHVALVVVAAALLLVGILPSGPSVESEGLDPAWRILLILTASIGLPYFVLSATGPLLQTWFGHAFAGRSPYRLYALSNAGSLIALLSYPFVFERLFDVPQQARIWSWGFAIFGVLCGYIAMKLRRGLPPPQPSPQGGGSQTDHERSASSERPRSLNYLLWLVWPALACIMLMATTNHISTDIAATPFLWVMPLSLYLVTLIVAFDRPQWYRPTLVAAATLAAIYAAGLVHKEGVGRIDVYACGTPGRLYQIASELLAQRATNALPPQSPQFRVDGRAFVVLNLAAMFGFCLLCHGQLVLLRPHPRYLTSFYLMIAAGGALGGVFVALLAPVVFNTMFEWELSLFVAGIMGVGILLRALVNTAFGEVESNRRPVETLLLSVLAGALLLSSAGVLLDLVEFLQPRDAGTLYTVRNFFGAIAVRERAENDPVAHNYLLRHGAITHGAQFTHSRRRREPTTYFGRTSGVGNAFAYYTSRVRPSGRMRVGVVGLGVGTLAAYLEAGDAITFYELNPAVVEIAENGPWFTFLRNCRERGGQASVTLGDARISLQREQQAEKSSDYHLLVLDAFSGDSIPMHLLTAEAFEVYLARLSTIGGHNLADGAHDEIEGAIAVHISNRFVDLEPILRGTAERFGLKWLRIHNKASRAEAIYSADWIILSRNEDLMRELANVARPQSKQSRRAVLWTDKRSSLFDVLK